MSGNIGRRAQSRAVQGSPVEQEPVRMIRMHSFITEENLANKNPTIIRW